MAKQIQELLIDDLTGGEAQGTIAFAIDGSSYEIDLNDVNAKKLRDALAPYITHARKTSSAARRRPSNGARSMNREKSSEIRQWAKAHGLPVSERGRIASTVVEKYEASR